MFFRWTRVLLLGSTEIFSCTFTNVPDFQNEQMFDSAGLVKMKSCLLVLNSSCTTHFFFFKEGRTSRCTSLIHWLAGAGRYFDSCHVLLCRLHLKACGSFMFERKWTFKWIKREKKSRKWHCDYMLYLRPSGYSGQYRLCRLLRRVTHWYSSIS